MARIHDSSGQLPGLTGHDGDVCSSQLFWGGSLFPLSRTSFEFLRARHVLEKYSSEWTEHILKRGMPLMCLEQRRTMHLPLSCCTYFSIPLRFP